MTMKKILIISGHYLPGYKDGGPVRTIKNLTDRLGREYEFVMLTEDRDAGDDKPYDLPIHREVMQGPVKVYYATHSEMNDLDFLEGFIKEKGEGAEKLYLTGCFGDYAQKVIRLKRANRFPQTLIIAAFGLFTPGAFHIKYPKKLAFMTVMRLLGMFDQVEWAATSIEEVGDIHKRVGKKAICHIAEDLPRVQEEIALSKASEAGSLRVIFLSRISRKKNLTQAARILAGVKGNVVFDIYGNEEDLEYTEECLQELRKLPDNIHWKMKGEAPAEEVLSLFGRYDVFLFPTMAENFGHVILEAMSGGCIPVISDKTPWTDEKLGFHGKAIPLEDEGAFTQYIQSLVDTESEALQKLREETYAYAGSYIEENAKVAEQAYREMLG